MHFSDFLIFRSIMFDYQLSVMRLQMLSLIILNYIAIYLYIHKYIHYRLVQIRTDFSHPSIHMYFRKYFNSCISHYRIIASSGRHNYKWIITAFHPRMISFTITMVVQTSAVLYLYFYEAMCSVLKFHQIIRRSRMPHTLNMHRIEIIHRNCTL